MPRYPSLTLSVTVKQIRDNTMAKPRIGKRTSSTLFRFYIRRAGGSWQGRAVQRVAAKHSAHPNQLGGWRRHASDWLRNGLRFRCGISVGAGLQHRGGARRHRAGSSAWATAGEIITTSVKACPLAPRTGTDRRSTWWPRGRAPAARCPIRPGGRCRGHRGHVTGLRALGGAMDIGPDRRREPAPPG